MRRPLLLVTVFLVTLGAPALAEDDATLTTIRTLGAEGQASFERGAYAEALDRFTRVDAMLKRHTIGVYIGRCLENLGRLNEAAERYLAVTRLEFPPELTEPGNAAKLKLQQEARATAEELRARLLPRIPAIVLDVDAPADVRLTIDGAPIARALFGVKRSTDPGEHVIEASSGGAVVRRAVSLREGQVLTVPLALHPTPGAAPSPQGEAPTTPRPPPDDAGSGSASNVRGTVAWVGIGLGVAGVAVGAVGAGLALSKRSEIDTQCGTDLHCTQPGTEALVNSYNADRTLSTVGFVVGFTALAGGVTLALTAPSRNPAPAVAAFVGPAYGGVKGTF